MPNLRLESATGDAFDLDGIVGTGRGVAALQGISGMGLPPVATQWFDGAGDGAQYRGERVLPRDIDLPLYVQAASRAELRTVTSRLARMLAGPMTLRFTENDGESWTLDVRRVGGGNVTLGPDSDATDWRNSVITLRAGDPFWTSAAVTRREIVASAGRGILLGTASLSALRLAASQTLGTITMENPGDATAYPVWTITGPGSAFAATSASGESFTWTGALTAGQWLTVDTRTASVKDHTGASRYAQLGPAPKLWRVPPGITTATISLADTTAASRISVEWRARKWTVV